MISREEYVLTKVKNFVFRHEKENQKIKASVLKNLIEQWDFDYKMEKEHRPEILRK